MTVVASIQKKAWVKAETTFDSVIAYSAADAVNMIELVITPNHEFEPDQGHTGTGSLDSEIEGMKGGTWSMTCHIEPSTAGTAPDAGPLYKAAFGVETASAAVVYSLSDTATTSLQIAQRVSDALYETINGAWVETCEFNLDGGTAPTVTFSGGFATRGWQYGGGTVNGAHGDTVATVTVTGGVGKYGVNALLQFGTAVTNGGIGYRVTAWNGTTSAVTFTPVLGSALSGGEVISSIDMAHTLDGNRKKLGGVNSLLQIDDDGGTARSISFQSFRASIATGVTPVIGEGNSDKATAVYRGPREVTGEAVVFFEDSYKAEIKGRTDADVVRQLTMRFGSSAASNKGTLDFPKTRIHSDALDIPDGEAVGFTYAFTARKNAAAGADEVSWTIA